MQIHLIAIGGALMHSLAISLKNSGHTVTGSDDEIYEPARANLLKANLLPVVGWRAENIHTGLDLVILGMHARKDNPELEKAKQLGIKISSYPQFLYEMSKEKLRIVVAGSHGKTSTTAAIMHLLATANVEFDYAVGSQLANFDNMVKLSAAKIIVIEGDEYLSSAEDPQAKFLHYQPNILILTGISWDHVNVFPDFEQYKQPFISLLKNLPSGGHLFYYEKDPVIGELLAYINQETVAVQGYQGFNYYINAAQKTVITIEEKQTELSVFGQHNLQNLNAAYQVAKRLNLTTSQIIKGLSSFVGASKRLEKIYQSPDKKFILFKDFAHAPSKVRATVAAVREQFADYKLVVGYELHTFSSFNPRFLPEYKHSLAAADTAYLYYNPSTLAKKQSPTESGIFTAEFLRDCFAKANLIICTDIGSLWAKLGEQRDKYPVVLLMMSSGNWDNADLAELASGQN